MYFGSENFTLALSHDEVVEAGRSSRASVGERLGSILRLLAARS